MSKVQLVLFNLTLFSIIQQSPGLIKVPLVEPNLILETEAAIRSSINDIFFMLKLKRAKEKTKLKRYGIVHNYFTSVTLKDYNSLKEVAQLTRVDHKIIDNTTLSFITMINGILNADNLTEAEENSAKFHEFISEDAANYLESYLKQLNYFQHIVAKGPRVNVNDEVAKILTNINIEDLNITEPNYNTSDDDNEYYNNVLDTNEFWQSNLQESRRIFNGRRTRIRIFPFMAVVQLFNLFQCAGSIVHADLVLTAASCLQLAYNNRFYRENPAFLSVRVGSNFYDGGGEVIPVQEIYFHPSYNPRNLRHNLALMRLVRFLKLTTSRVKKIAIDTELTPLPMNTGGITMIGWGAKTTSNVVKNGWHNKLSYAILDIYSLQDCMNIFSKDYVTHRHFCAGFLSKGSGACNRDVGGPGVAAGILRGVVSFGSPQCGTPDVPTVFTKVGFYSDWIETIMMQDVPRGNVMSTTRSKPRSPPTYSPRLRSTTAFEDIHMNLLGEFTDTPEVFYQPATTDTTTTSSTTTTTQQVGRHGKKVDVQLFKDFLRTMFDSKEIDDYINQFIDDKSIGPQRKSKKSTTDTIQAIQYATNNVNFDPAAMNSDIEEIKEYDSVVYAATPKISQEENESEKELESDLSELINNRDINKTLIKSASNDPLPPSPSPPPTTLRSVKNRLKKKKLKSEKVKNNKSKKKLKKKGKKMSKKNEPSMTFLYLNEEDETENDYFNNIYNKVKEENAEPEQVLLDVTDDGNDQDVDDDIEYIIEHDDGEDTAEIAKNLETIRILPNIPDIPEIPMIPEVPEPYEPGTMLDFNFRSKDELDDIIKSDSVSKNLIVDILNEVIKSESKLLE